MKRHSSCSQATGTLNANNVHESSSVESLRKRACLPCAPKFAVGNFWESRHMVAVCLPKNTQQILGTRQRPYLPCATSKNTQHTTTIFCCVPRRPLGRSNCLSCVFVVCCVPRLKHTAIFLKKFKSTLLTFSAIHILYVVFHVNFWYVSQSFCYI